MKPYFTDFLSLKGEIKKQDFAWKSPSNIALVKYWGKKEGIQIPANPSISMTLDHCHTETSLKIKSGTGKIAFLYDGELKPSFIPKIEEFFEKISPEFPDLSSFDYEIHSKNTFPHSTGIASSASGMSALALCFSEFACNYYGIDQSREEFLKLASHWARLGSGSACRSLFKGFSQWGESKGKGSIFHGIEVSTSSFWDDFRDSILIVSSKEKKVSSRAGHAHMNGHPFSKARYQEAAQNVELTLEYLANDNWSDLGELLEREALTLHSLMMSGAHPFILIEPASLKLIDEVKSFRLETGVPVYFTLDAGPNLHLLYPGEFSEKVHAWLKSLESKNYFQNIIHDRMGMGASQLNER